MYQLPSSLSAFTPVHPRPPPSNAAEDSRAALYVCPPAEGDVGEHWKKKRRTKRLGREAPTRRKGKEKTKLAGEKEEKDKK
jgi:hypothetical protein